MGILKISPSGSPLRQLKGITMLPLAAILDVGMRVLDKFVPDPEAKAKALADGWLNND
jgi:hypothetical protein